MKMRRSLIERGVVFAVVAGAALVAAWFYKQGKISFFGKSGSSSVNKEAQNKTIEIPFTEKEYKLLYEKDIKDKAINIARFEEDEKWGGDGDFEYVYFWEGKTGLSLVSRDYTVAKTFLGLEKPFDFSEFLKFRLFVYLETNPDNVEKFRIIFADGTKREYSFPMRNLNTGWNILELPAEKFSVSENGEDGGLAAGEATGNSIIETVRFELVSRPKTNSALVVDYLWGEKEDFYRNEWSASHSKFLSFGTDQGRAGLLATNLYGSLAVSKKISAAKNYSVSMQFIPLKKGSFGLFLRGNISNGFGYYLTFEGVESGNWQIIKNGVFDEKQQTVTLERGTISGFMLEERKPYWLKADVGGSDIAFYFSEDGTNYTKLADAVDRSFASGRVGLTVGSNGMVLVGEMKFQNKI